ncbi:NAD(P)/FAD-dependent oxidoreductase [Allohahella marinimesophila]|uniref:NAD(P)/FAD-dependent oxidoreductase n=1 Tax=Allohahella marinimesophila TaxID=1054972 RepID=A0ABP7PKT4_9GAMM
MSDAINKFVATPLRAAKWLRSRLVLSGDIDVSDRHVLVVGGNFGGLAAAIALQGICRVTVVDPRPDFEWTPHIHDILSGLKLREHLCFDRARLFQQLGQDFIQSSVEALDPIGRQIVLKNGRELRYDACIVACGGEQAPNVVPGGQQHTTGFRHVDQAEHIERALATLSEKQKLVTVTIIGGGLSGVEALGSILRNKRFKDKLKVQVVDAQDLLPEFSDDLAKDVRKQLKKKKVTFHTGPRSAVKRVSRGHIELVDGQMLPSDLTIWTAGIQRQGLVKQLCEEKQLHLQTAEDGIGLLVDNALNPVLNKAQYGYADAWRETLFFAGDCASIVDQSLHKQAYHALDMGEHAAENALRYFKADKPANFTNANKPVLIALGDLEHYFAWNGLIAAGGVFEAMKESVFQVYMARYSMVLDLKDASMSTWRRGTRALTRQLLPGMLPSGFWQTVESLFPNPIIALPRAALRRFIFGQRIIHYANPFNESADKA